jgi:hypothetical protein
MCDSPAVDFHPQQHTMRMPSVDSFQPEKLWGASGSSVSAVC